MITYLAYIEKGDAGYGAFFPDLPGCISAGDSIQETIMNAHEALALHIQGIEEDKEELPDAVWDGTEENLDTEYQGGKMACVAAVTAEYKGVVRRYNVTLPENLVKRIDARQGPGARSAFLAQAAKEKLANA